MLLPEGSVHCRDGGETKGRVETYVFQLKGAQEELDKVERFVVSLLCCWSDLNN